MASAPVGGDAADHVDDHPSGTSPPGRDGVAIAGATVPALGAAAETVPVTDRSPQRRTEREVQRVISTVCLQCGTPSERARGSFCRRCGLPYGERPSSSAELPSCPVCYRTVDDDGRLPSLDRPSLRVDLVRHRSEHERHPVGDDDWLETLRTGDRISIDRWNAPFATVRRYLVTGQIDAGRNRALAHDAIVTAMTQLNRWGPDADIFGDLPDWKAARSAVTALMERYGRGRVRV